MLLTRPRFGVEIEYVSANLNQNQMAEALTNAGLTCNAERYNHETRDVWKLTTDSSCGMELVSPPLWYEDRFAVAEALRVLNRNGAMVNDNCGLHVHHEWPWIKDQQLSGTDAGVRRRTNKERRIVRLYETCLPLLQVVLPADRFSAGVLDPESEGSESANRFCRWNAGSTSRGNRYVAINFAPLADRTTIEFRQHHGTLNADQVLAWIELTRQLVHVASTRDGATTTLIPLIFEKLSGSTWTTYDTVARDHDTTLPDLINEITNPTIDTTDEEY